MTRVAVFIDYQNIYMSARETFGLKHEHFVHGQVYPRRLGLLVTARGRVVDPMRELERVWVFRGEPVAKHSRSGQAACQRQVEYWSAQRRVSVVTRPLKYYEIGRNAYGEVMYEAREKGIDVLLALYMVMGAMRDEYDVAVLASADTDLVPALETVLELGKRCEVVAWQAKGGRNSRLSIPGRNLWCHWLKHRDYENLCDPTDYTKPQPGGLAEAED